MQISITSFPRLLILFIGLSIFAMNCNSSESSQKYIPKYQDKWQEVAQMIHKTWGNSRVDSNVKQMPGSLKLPYEYFSIHENVNVLYCWDTYFTNAGLLQIDSFTPFAKNAIDNQFSEIDQLGFVPNASEPWGLNRSQIPYLSMMVKEVYESGLANKEWLLRAYEKLKQDYLFWTDTSSKAIENHNTPISGLQRFYHHATREELLEFYNVLAPRFDLSYDVTDEFKLKMGEAWMTEAEVGMDFTPRFENRCHEFIAIDLNANLYVYEKNFDWITKELAIEEEVDWNAKASRRKALITRYMWDENRGLFRDYDFVNQRFSKVASVATFYPLWAGLATKEQAKKLIANLPLFEYTYGPTICEKSQQDRLYQWDYPAGWPPIYMLMVKALDKYGYKKEALRMAGKYLDIVTKNYLKPEPEMYASTIGGKVKDKKRDPGFVYEKYDVVEGTIYDTEYAARPFHGWSYAVYISCLEYYNSHLEK